MSIVNSRSSRHTVFGVRHHGPGSAYSLVEALDELQPDIVLVEGPADATELIPWLGDEQMEPPVALILYDPDKPKRASYFPFAIFSPELQAIRHALKRGIPACFFDLPQGVMLASPHKVTAPDTEIFRLLAEATGFQDYEQWWNQLIEQRLDRAGIFDAILKMMQALRTDGKTFRSTVTPHVIPRTDALEGESTQEPDIKATQKPATDAEIPPPENSLPENPLAEQREAYMRQCIRKAYCEGYQRIAVVCGAWHAPALLNVEGKRSEGADEIMTDTDALGIADADLLHDLPQIDVEGAWVPWTYSRMSYFTGYGAGISSPGWYHHLWEMNQQQATPTNISIHWLTKVANLLRDQQADSASVHASAAHLIETVRLAEALAALRDLPFPGLLELNEATQAVICFGDSTILRLIQRKLIVGERMGAVPPDTPMVPLQRDLYQLQRKLRLRPEPEKSVLSLDLRNEMHLERSHLLHRLKLLNIPWGNPMPVRGKSGTYREVWRLQWLPDYSLRVIEANVWGNTVRDAAMHSAQHKADSATDLATLTLLLDQIILADLPNVIGYLMQRIEETAALSSDIPHMMEALPPLARVLRYGSVRQMDKGAIQEVVDSLLTRICIGLPTTCSAMNDDAAADMFDRLMTVHGVVTTLQNRAQSEMWIEVLELLAEREQTHGLLAGRAFRLLVDGSRLTSEQAMLRLTRVLSVPVWSQQGKNPEGTAQFQYAAFWLEGFLRGSGLILLHDRTLWRLIDEWVVQVPAEDFLHVLPMLRRVFASFSEQVRQQLDERVRFGQSQPQVPTISAAFDHERAKNMLLILEKLLG
ncbi:hypothetical protein KFU94_48380 [Chloroflexi bacterium TSY]|nr:hypothetical protein [Chloroflexi bacterium TSY]